MKDSSQSNSVIEIRPQTLGDFAGQEHIKNNLKVIVEAGKQRQEAIDHILFYGPPGLGKTTLANVIAGEMGVSIKTTSGPAIERSGDLAAILTNLKAGDVLFIDEIHRLNKVVEEVLYPAMEDYALDIIVGKGPAARTLRLDLPRFTVIGATTRIGAIASPLRDRFGAVYRLQYYNNDQLTQIVLRSAQAFQLTIVPDAAKIIAVRCRKTPRIANRLLRRIRDYALVKGEEKIRPKLVEDALKVMEIDTFGLDHSDRLYLKTLCIKYDGGPVGLDTLAVTMSDDAVSIEEVAEPFLLQLGFIKRTKQGRVATKKAFHYLDTHN